LGVFHISFHTLHGPVGDDNPQSARIFKTPPPMTRWQRGVGEGPGIPEKCEVYYPPLLVEKIEERWNELGFESLSEYVISVMRYDLLLGGKHRHFPNNDFHSEIPRLSIARR
jgi:hypothetical protein